MSVPISALEKFAQSLAIEVASLKVELARDPEWCARTHSRLQVVWGGEISQDEFLNQFVQTLTFAFLLAKTSEKSEISGQNLEKLLPRNIPVLSEIMCLLMPHIKEDSRIDAAVSRLTQIINNNLASPINFSEISASVYMYEPFLQAFSAKSRRKLGVFYTPPEIVEFIVKNVQYLLQKDEGIAGLSDNRIRLIDFSVGTGAFLLDSIKKTIEEKTSEIDTNAFIHEKILAHFMGFEPFLAPNVIAQLNIVKLLQDPPVNYRFSPSERIKVFPYNTLEDPLNHKDLNPEPPSANVFPVILGNPPYAADSRNNTPWILDLLGTYKVELVEKNLKPLNDDYVKFLRYAQWCVEQAGQGIVGVITNNSFFDGIVHRVMRASLFQTFNRIYLLNLHGHQGEDQDESLFDIRKVGVAICFFVKMPAAPQTKEVFYFSSLDNGLFTRAEKIDFLRNHNLKTIPWARLEVQASQYWLKPRTSQEEETYIAGWGLDEIFEVYTSGIETGNDDFYIALLAEKDALVARVRDALLSQDEGTIKKKYHWMETTNQTFQKLRTHGQLDRILDAVYPLHYRPLDIRWCYYERGAMSRDRYEVMRHLTGKDYSNLALISVRQVGGPDSFTHVLVTDTIVDNRIMKSTKGKGYVFPLFRREGTNRVPNLRAEFLQCMAKLIGKVPEIEELFAYIYAILNSPGYRHRYAIQLRKGFPRIAFPNNPQQFEAMARAGQELIDAHLLRTPPAVLPTLKIHSPNTSIIAKQHVHYDPETQRVFFNEGQFVEGVPPDIWNFQIGGWPVLSHWLSERGGRTFGREEQQIFGQILYALTSSKNFSKKCDVLFS